MHNMLNCQGIAQAACLVKEDSKLIFKDTIKRFTSPHVTAESSVLACSHSLRESIPNTIYKIMLFHFLVTCCLVEKILLPHRSMVKENKDKGSNSNSESEEGMA